MKLPDDIKDFLPRYLTEESTQVLLQQIDDYAKEGTTDKVYAYPLSNDEQFIKVMVFAICPFSNIN